MGHCVLQNIHGHVFTTMCHSQHIHFLWRFGFSCSPERWKVFSLEGPLLGYESLLIITTHKERLFGNVKWYLYIYFWTVHFHLIICIISTASRRKSILFFFSERRSMPDFLLTNTQPYMLHFSSEKQSQWPGPQLCLWHHLQSSYFWGLLFSPWPLLNLDFKK